MRIAVIADVHGNAAALEAVLAKLLRHSVDLLVNLGDCASGPLWPRQAVDLLRGATAFHVRGNHDRALGSASPQHLGASDRFAWQRLDENDRAWLAGLPGEIEPAPQVRCFHACPGNDEAYFMEDVIAGRLLPSKGATAAARLGNSRSRLVLCGHSHLPAVLRLADGTVIVNPDSVGCPAYHDATEQTHVSESGSPHARFALVTLTESIDVELHAATYDWERAAEQAERNGRRDWAHALRTGTSPSGAGVLP
ncbi:metallophosphatase family protein [Bosea sp. LjRoot90]|uniref:metallophosphoesterase family protein n=1 Tax=Bosea sp. LjRoot90 TaxID=3342342 RepID=UPI003ECE16E1